MKRTALKAAFGEMFDELDGDDSGYLEREELENDTTKMFIRKMFESVGVSCPSQDLENIFDLLDVDGSGSIEREEFINGAIQLSEDVRPISIMELNHQVLDLKQMVHRNEL